MRIAAVCEAFPRRSERFLARDLAALAAHGIEPLIFTLGPGGEDAAWSEPEFAALRGCVRRLPSPLSLSTMTAKLAQPVGVLRALGVLAGLPRSVADDPRRTGAGFLRLAAAWPLALAARREECELIWGLWASLPGAVAALAARAAGLPLAVSCHAWDVFVNRAWLRMELGQAALFAACNGAAAARLKELFGEAASKVELIRHILPANDSPAPRQFPGDRPPRILAVGRLVGKKGFEYLLSAAAQGACEVELVGDGPERGRLEALAAGRVRFSGWLDSRELALAYARSDALCVPSVVAPDGDRDGVPNVLLEATQAGLPIIATDAGGLPDFAVHGRTALVVPQRDAAALAAAAQRLGAEPGLAAGLVAGARELLRTEFDPERNAARLAGLLRTAAGRRR